MAAKATRYTHRPLKIALLAPLVTPIGPPFVGGAQVMLHDLGLGLARRGHQVSLFAATGSQMEAAVKLVEITVRPGELRPTDFNAPESDRLRQPGAAFFRQSELFLQIFLQLGRTQPPFDIAHAHAFDWPVFALGSLSPVPVVHTVHLPDLDQNIKAILQTSYAETGYSQAVTVSQACAATYGQNFRFDRIIYNGIETAAIPFGERGEGYLMFAGRMTPEKGPDLAIRIARAAGRRLVLAGGVYDRLFFEQVIAPELATDPNLTYLGPLDRANLFQWMSRADGLLFPSRWAEPFGLVLAESLAAGTPVISWRNGAAPEIIDPGRTGFLIDYNEDGSDQAIEEAARCVSQLSQLDRRECRRQIDERFSAEKMLDEYENYYHEVIAR